MKIKSIKFKNLKRFKELDISGLPESAKLVVLVGPNGCGKSSLFDAIKARASLETLSYTGFVMEDKYYNRTDRNDDESIVKDIDISFHNNQSISRESWKKAVYVRSAYRNDPDFSMRSFHSPSSPLDEEQIKKLIDNDKSVERNYIHLVLRIMNDVFNVKNTNKTSGELQKELLGDIQGAIKKLFPKLILDGFGGVGSEESSFQFIKRGVRFSYKNLSGGEKAALDLILDLIVKRQDFDDTVFCIDEPEAHIGLGLQRKLLSILYSLIPDNSQLWIATHSIGMMREAVSLQQKNHDDVVFLDFSNRDFDKEQKMQPAQMDRPLWERMHEVTLDNLAGLVLPDSLFVCESEPEKSFDADCYNTIFSSTHPTAKFISVGSKTHVERLASLLKKAFPGSGIIALRDRDNMTDEEVRKKREKGIRVLSLTCIEEYLLADEVLKVFCKKYELLGEMKTLKRIRNDSSKMDFKKAGQNIRTHIIQCDKTLKIGDNGEEFLRETLAPLLVPDMSIYKQLEKDVFGD